MNCVVPRLIVAMLVYGLVRRVPVELFALFYGVFYLYLQISTHNFKLSGCFCFNIAYKPIGRYVNEA